jgi:hypothetical protein
VTRGSTAAALALQPCPQPEHPERVVTIDLSTGHEALGEHLKIDKGQTGIPVR